MDVWRTFCHISEYGDWGYRNLHRMIAASDPLVVWAPSSRLLRAGSVAPREFLRYVDEGHVRVAGREEWLTSPEARDRHAWPEAAWDAEVDGELRRWAEADASAPLRERRVVVAGPERGAERAKDDSAALRAITRDYRGGRARQLIPAGTLEHARRHSGTPEQAAQLILRDAYNHGIAIAETECDTAVLLSAAEGRFLKYLSEVHADERAQAGTYAAAEARRELRTNAELVDQVIDLLRDLEVRGGKVKLRDFMARPEHEGLVRWTRDVADRLRTERAADLEQALRRDLARRLEEGRFPALLGRTEGSLGTAGAVLGALGLMGGVEALAVGSLVIDAVPMASAALKRMGWVDPGFDGPQWPFRYTYGSHATPARHDALLDILDLE